jgi:hypothetical protein
VIPVEVSRGFTPRSKPWFQSLTARQILVPLEKIHSNRQIRHDEEEPGPRPFEPGNSLGGHKGGGAQNAGLNRQLSYFRRWSRKSSIPVPPVTIPPQL